MLALDRRQRHAAAPRRGRAARGVVSRRRERRGVARAARARRRARRTARRRTVDTLSGGNQQKVLFAQVAVPHAARASSPTSRPAGVDVGAKRAIYELIHSLAAEGMARAPDLVRARGGARPRPPRARHARRADRRRARPATTMSEDAVLHAAFATEARRRRPMSATRAPRRLSRGGTRAPPAAAFDLAVVRDYGIVVAFVGALHHAVGHERRLPDVGQHAEPRVPDGADRDHRLRRDARVHRRRLRPLGRRDLVVLRR